MKKHKLSKLSIVYLRIALFALLFLGYTNSYSQSGVGIGTSTPNANAVLDIVSTSNDKGILIPRLTSAQRTAMNASLTVSENGLMVFDTDLNGFYFWNGTVWNAITVVQDLQLIGNTLTITNNASASDIDLSSIVGTNTDNQTLALTGSNLTITGGNSIDLSSIQDGVDDADNNPANEIQDLQLVGNTLTITNNASATDIDLSSIAGANTDNQTLALAGSSLTITGGNSIDLSPIQDGVDDADNNPVNEIQDLQLVGNTLTITNNASATDINLAAFSGTNTDNQTISLTGTNLSITGGNTLDLAAIQDGVDDADADPTNELQTVSKVGNTVTLSNGGGSFTDAVNDADASVSNELQTISKTGSVITLSNGGGSFTDAVNDADASATNELITGATLIGTTLSITDAGGNTNVNLAGLQDGFEANTDNQNLGVNTSGTNRTLTITGGTNATFSVADNDNSTTNEIQDLQLSGNILTITNNASPTSINLAAFSGTNTDNQTLSLAGTDITITGGNTLDLSPLQDGVDDADNDPANEIQTITKVGSTVTLSNGGGSFTDADASASNELQTISKTGVVVTLSDGGGSFNVNDADASTSNELQNLGSSAAGTNRTVTITGGTNATFSIADNDNSATNEIQTIARTGSTVTLSDLGGSFSVNDADASASNELQNLGSSAAGTNRTVTITGGTDATFSIADNDNSTTNELVTGATLIGTTLRITDAGGNTNVNLASLQDGTGSDNQTLSFNGSTNVLTISGGNTSNLSVLDQNLASVLANGNSAGNRRITNLLSPINPNDAARRAYVDAQDHTDNQTLSVSGSTLTIAGGNSVSLPSAPTVTKEAFKAYLSGITNVASGSGGIDFDASSYNLNGSYGGGKFTAIVNGIYTFNGVFDLKMIEASPFAIVLTINGINRYQLKDRTFNGGGVFIGYAFSVDFQLNAGDLVQFQLVSPNAQQLNGGSDNESFIAGKLVVEL